MRNKGPADRRANVRRVITSVASFSLALAGLLLYLSEASENHPDALRYSKGAVTERVWQLLLVEDNVPDVALMREALRESGFRFELHTAANAQAALAFLFQRPPYPRAPRPDLVLLDLNLGHTSGLEVLHTAKTSEALSGIPMVVFTSSARELDVLEAYRSHANSYVRKPPDLDRYFATVGSILSYWLTVTRHPRGAPEFA